MALKVISGASLLLAWQLKDRRVLIVGGGEVASQRLISVLCADALVTIISPRKGLHPVVADLISSSPQITYHDRTFYGPDDLTDVDMVLTAIDDVSVSRDICALCRTLHIPVNVADIPSCCDFYFGAQIRRGPLQIMVSTNGNGPRLAGLIKHRIEEALPANVDKAIEKVGVLRKRLRQRAPGVGGDLGKRRMKWMTSICETWSLEDLTSLDEDSMERLLDEGWEHDVALGPQDILKQSWMQLPRSWYMGRFGQFSAGFITGVIAVTAIILIGRRR